MALFALVAVLCIGCAAAAAAPPAIHAPGTAAGLALSVSVDNRTGAFELLVAGAPWLTGSSAWVSIGGRTFSAADGSLRLVHAQGGLAGTDAIGAWEGTTLTWDAGGTAFQTRFREYASVRGGCGGGHAPRVGAGADNCSDIAAAPAVVVFEQAFPDGATNLSVGDKDALASAFPAFNLSAPVGAQEPGAVAARSESPPVSPLGFTQWAAFGTPGTDANAAGTWPPPAGDKSAALAASWDRETGAMAIFNAALDAAVVVSPLTSFDAWGQTYTDTRLASRGSNGAPAGGAHRFDWGLRGTVDSVPGGFTMSVAVVGTAGGINEAMVSWGDVLLRNGGGSHGRRRRGDGDPEDDVSTAYLGYTTANGAYYYYNTEPGKNYQRTVLDLKAYLDEQRIPVRWILYDSWFYSKKGSTGPNPSNGCTNWTDADPAVFPSGLRYMYDQTGWPVVAHSRAWSAENVYLKTYDWALGQDLAGDVIALPMEQRFWGDLFDAATRWGCVQYQQDWMYTQQGMAQLQASTVLAEQWQAQMNTALRERGMRFGFGGVRMSNWLQSSAYPTTATNGRATDDYHAGLTPQWQIGVPSVFVWALGAVPNKDGFWTTPSQPGHPYKDNRTEPYARLHAAVATLTKAQVTPSDGIGFANRDLIMRSCRDDGRLLQPAAPARALDVQLAQMAFRSTVAGLPDPGSQLWGTVSEVPGAGTFVHVLAADMKRPAALKPTDLACAGVDGAAAEVAAGSFLAFENSNATGAEGPAPAVVPVSATAPLQVPACGRADFRLFHLAPVLSNGWTLLGEVGKWVPTAAARFVRVDVVGGGSGGGGSGGGGGGRGGHVGSGVLAHVVGAENETVAVAFADPGGNVTTVSCKISARQAVVVSTDGACSEP